MYEFMNEYSEIIIAALTIIASFLAWLQLRTRAKMEIIENKQIKIQSDADNQKSQLDILKSALADIPKSRETWQGVVDRMSERRKEESDRTIFVLDKIEATIDKNSHSVENLSSVLEIQSEKYINLVDAVKRTENVVVEESKATRDSVDTIKSTIAQHFETIEKALSTLTARFDDIIDMQSSHIEIHSNRDDNIKKELVALQDAIKTMSSIINGLHAMVEKIDTASVKPDIPDNEEKIA